MLRKEMADLLFQSGYFVPTRDDCSISVSDKLSQIMIWAAKYKVLKIHSP